MSNIWNAFLQFLLSMCLPAPLQSPLSWWKWLGTWWHWCMTEWQKLCWHPGYCRVKTRQMLWIHTETPAIIPNTSISFLYMLSVSFGTAAITLITSQYPFKYLYTIFTKLYHIIPQYCQWSLNQIPSITLFLQVMTSPHSD